MVENDILIIKGAACGPTTAMSAELDRIYGDESDSFVVIEIRANDRAVPEHQYFPIECRFTARDKEGRIRQNSGKMSRKLKGRNRRKW